VTETYLARLATEVEDTAGAGGGAAGQVFALKLLRPDRVPDGSFAKVARRFVAAGRQLHDFHRPGFGKVVDVSDDPAATLIVTEHIAGRDLARLIETSRAEAGERAGLDPALAGLLGSEIARLLHVGHTAKPPFCHLGLAPQNVSVTAAGEVVILDLGIAASLRGITEQPVERWFYVAPELQGVDPGSVVLDDREAVAADLYSLGALLFYLVFGRPLVEASTPSELVGRKRLPDMPDMPETPSKLSAAMRTLLSPEPEDRPESAAMLVEWLAGGVDVARDRQALIADGVRAIETGAQSSPSAPPEPAGQAPRGPLPSAATGTHSARLEIAERAGRRSPARRVLVPAGLIFVAGVASAIVATRFLSHERSLAFQGRVDEQGRVKSVEMSPRVPAPMPENAQASTETTGVGAEARAASDPSLSRVAGHLIAETAPPGAMLWVDGILKGKTFTDIVVGDGGHRVVLIAPGHRMFRDVVDTTTGVIIRRTLPAIDPPIHGNGFIDVECRTSGKFPVLVDEEETGLLCPIKMMPTTTGKHLVGIFVPPERRTVAVETTVDIGSKPAVVKFSE
jgi:serine/threonine protein kinase